MVVAISPKLQNQDNNVMVKLKEAYRKVYHIFIHYGVYAHLLDVVYSNEDEVKKLET